MSKIVTFKSYDFSLAAGASKTILAEGSYFRVQSSLGAVDVTVDSVGTMPGLVQGQGLSGVPYTKLTIKDVSGTLNSGFLLVASAEVVDNRTYGVNDLSTNTLNTLTHPQAHTGYSNVQGALAATTPETIFSAASNINGCVLLDAGMVCAEGTFTNMAMLAKATAPASLTDGVPYLRTQNATGTNYYVQSARLFKEQFIPANLGLYVISDSAVAALNGNHRWTRYRLL
jgi:hypothetical protein